ncbi:MAG: hypothetical protein Fur0016_28780 [Anaerolineales bacterium]
MPSVRSCASRARDVCRQDGVAAGNEDGETGQVRFGAQGFKQGTQVHGRLGVRKGGMIAHDAAPAAQGAGGEFGQHEDFGRHVNFPADSKRLRGLESKALREELFRTSAWN